MLWIGTFVTLDMLRKRDRTKYVAYTKQTWMEIFTDAVTTLRSTLLLPRDRIGHAIKGCIPAPIPVAKRMNFAFFVWLSDRIGWI